MKTLLTSLVVCMSAALAAGEPVRVSPPPSDYIPPQWTALNIQWKPTWDETLKANPEQNWRTELSKNKSLVRAAGRIAPLRRITLLNALIKRFPAEKTKHAQALITIGKSYQQIGMRDWASYYGWRLSREFPDRKDLLPDAYNLMMGWGYGRWNDPGWRNWAFAPFEAFDLVEAGVIPPKHQASWFAFAYVVEPVKQEDRYDQFRPVMERLEKIGPKYPRAFGYLTGVYYAVGDYAGAAKASAKAKDPRNANWYANAAANSPIGTLSNLPTDAQLKLRWEALKRGGRLLQEDQPIRAEEFQKVLDLCARGSALWAESDSHYVPFGAVVERTLNSLDRSRTAPLRELQQQAVRHLVARLRRRPDRGELIRLTRQYPYARSLHELLVESGEQDLRRGDNHYAISAFGRVLEMSDDTKLLMQARVGMWLAMASQPNARAAMLASMAEVPDTNPMPWRGATITAGQLKKRLQAHSHGTAAKSVPLSQLKKIRIQMPPDWTTRQHHEQGPVADMGLSAPWPITQIAAGRDALFVTGPRRIARFDRPSGKVAWAAATAPPWQTTEPMWNVRTAGQQRRNLWWAWLDRRPVIVRWAEDVVDGHRRLYSLQNRRTTAVVAAVDAATGRTVWSTQGSQAWKDLEPISRPAAAEGRVYVLAIPANLGPTAGRGPRQQPGPPVLWHLVCLNARTGQMQWRRPLGWQPFTFLDLARWTNPVTVYQGAVYCATNMGLIARCDAVDGQVQWVRAYASSVLTHAHSPNFRRGGSAPLIAGETVLIAPRDHSGVLAFDDKTGRQLWESIIVPSEQLVGVSGRTVVAVGPHWLVGLDIKTGQPLWYREFTDGTGSQAVVIGPDVVVASGAKIWRVHAATGKDAESLALDRAVGAQTAFLDDGTLVEIVPPDPAGGRQPSPAPAAPLRLPLTEAWALSCDNPQIIFPEEAPARSGKFIMLSGSRITLVQTRPAWKVLWQQVVHQRPQAVAFIGDAILVAVRNDILSLGAADGKTRWRISPGFTPHDVIGDTGLILAVSAPNSWGYVCAIDPGTGKIRWTRSFNERLRTQSNLYAATLRSGAIHLYWPAVLFGDVGNRPGEIILDPANGRIRQIRHAIPKEPGWPQHPTFDAGGISYLGRDKRLHILAPDGKTDLAAAWARTFDVSQANRYPGAFGYRRTGAKLWVWVMDVLHVYDTATAAEMQYGLPKGAPGFTPIIFDFREIGDRLLVASGLQWQRHDQDLTRTRMFVDAFDRQTGAHLGRQELTGLPCCGLNFDGYQTQAKILDDAVVVTDPYGVHVLAYSKTGGPLQHPQAKKGLTPAQLQAEQQIIAALGTLPVTTAPIIRAEQSASISGPRLVQLYQAWMTQNRAAVTAARMTRMHSVLSAKLGRDAKKELLRAAAAARVAAPVVARFNNSRSAELSQWVYIEKGTKPEALAVGLFDGRHWRYASLHGVVGGTKPPPPNTLTFLPWRCGNVGEPETWTEIRVPLNVLGMQDKPIRGIAFRHQGRGQVHWDDTALVLPDGRKVIVEDTTPPGLEVGRWIWNSKFKHSGQSAHFMPAPNQPRRVTRHAVLLTEPIRDHLPARPAGQPVMTQQVFLDPVRPPKSIAIYLHDGGQWRECIRWGRQVDGEFYLGPMPETGKWVDLKVPLSLTHVANRPVTGIAFRAEGGTAWWAETTVAAGGQVRTIIADTLNGVVETARVPGWQWDDQAGRRAHTSAATVNDGVHLVTGLLRPVTVHLPIDREKALTAMTHHLPALGNTDPAWRIFSLMQHLEGGTARQRSARCDWFTKALPDHPRAKDVAAMRDRLADGHPPMDAQAQIARLLNEWTRKATAPAAPTSQDKAFLTDWLILGGFHNHPKSWMMMAAVEMDPFNIKSEYVQHRSSKKVSWMRHHSPRDYVDLAFTADYHRHLSAVGVCWVYAPQPHMVRMDIGGTRGIQVRVNRHLVFAVHTWDHPSPRSGTVYITLPAGWNEIMVKAGKLYSGHGFFFEIRDPTTGRRPDELIITTQPPQLKS